MRIGILPVVFTSCTPVAQMLVDIATGSFHRFQVRIQASQMKARDPHVRLTTLALTGGWYGYALADMPAAFRDDHLDHLLPTPDQWPDLLNQLHPDPSTVPGYSVLKFSRSVEVYRVTPTVAGRCFDLIIKRSRRSARRLSDYVRGAREHRNFNRALVMRAIGIRTALPLAVLERRAPKRSAYMVSAFVPDVMDLDTIATTHLGRLDWKARVRAKHAIGRAVVNVLGILREHRLIHRDLKASNIMLANWIDVDSAHDIYLLDLDGIHRPRLAFERRQWTMLARLFASLSHCHDVTQTDAVRFLRLYIDTTNAHGGWRARFLELTTNARRYNHRAKIRKRKLGKLDSFIGE